MYPEEGNRCPAFELPDSLNFEIRLDGNWIMVRGRDYINSSINANCRVCIEPDKNGMWILGAPVMMGYYSVFNLDTKQFGMTPHI